jgi:PAS domain S-box-containing protein
MYRIRRDGTYVDFDAKDEDDLIAPPGLILGHTMHEYLPPGVDVLFDQAIARTLDTGEVQTVEYQLRRRRRGLRDLEARIACAAPDEVLVIIRDITARKQAEAEVELQRSLRDTIAEATPSLLIVVDEFGRFVADALNGAAKTLLGYEADEIEGHTFWGVLVAAEDAADAREAFERVARGGPAIEEDSWLLTRGGERRLVAWACTPLLDEPERRWFLISGTDITERKRHESQLQLERDFLNTVANTTPSPLCIVDNEGRLLHRATNPAFERALGVDPWEVEGIVFWQRFVPAEEADEVRERIEEVMAGGPTREHDNHWLATDGRRLLVAWSCTRLSAETDRYLVCGVDVTERKRQEEELRHERDFATAILDITPGLLVVLEPSGRVLRHNRACWEVVRCGEDEDLHAVPFWELFVEPGEGEVVRAGIEAMLAGERTSFDYEAHVTMKTGERRTYAWVARPLLGPEGEAAYVISIGVDVTDRKRHEEELRRSRARIVEAGDQERRRLERNLHDGAQQRLVSLSLSLRLARAKLRKDSDAADQLLTGASDELSRALEELRELARGIHPAVLSDRGLAPALETLAARSPVPVEIYAPAERLPESVEAAAYYVVSEALANVVKYARASTAAVRVEPLNGTLRVEVVDDGVGGADSTRGTGLRGLADRVSALDGRLEVESPPGEGTRVRAEIPLPSAGA